MLNNLSSVIYDPEQNIDSNRYDRNSHYPCFVNKFCKCGFWLVVHLVYVAILVGLIVNVYFTKQEVSQLRDEVKQCNQIKSSTDEIKSDRQTKVNNLFPSSVLKKGSSMVKNVYHRPNNNKDTNYDDQPVEDYNEMYDPFNADGEIKADQSADASSKLNKLQSIDQYEHSIMRRQRPIEHQKPKPRSFSTNNEDNSDNTNSLKYIGIGIHLTEGDQNFMSSSAAAPDLRRVVRYWKSNNSKHNELFGLPNTNGTITIPYTGRYLIYAQISLSSNADSKTYSVQFRIIKTSNGNKIMKCHSDLVNSKMKRNEIFCTMTSQATLSASEKLQMINADTVEDSTRVNLEVHKDDTFWGMIYLGQ